jgi:hypothetical protein
MAGDDVDPAPAGTEAGTADDAKATDAAGSVAPVALVTDPVAPVEDPPEAALAAVVAPAPPRRRGISRRAKVVSVAVVVVVGLIAGLVAWSPWQPNPPADVRASSPTATSTVVSWQAAGGLIAGPSSYLVLRDGRQVGSVPASATSWADHGLTPGATYHYTVVAAGLGRSSPSASATVTTITPSPVRLTARTTHSTVELHWSPSPLAPAPGQYVVSNGTTVVATLPGTTTSYTEKGLAPGTSFQYTVAAQWGGFFSGPSPAANGATVAAPLSDSVPVHVDTTSSPGPSWGPMVAGYQWDDTWNAMPSCTPGNCTMKVIISIAPSDAYDYTPFPVTLDPSGTGYSGTAEAQVTGCKTPTQVISETDTISLILKPAKGHVQNGAWSAWTGTMVMSAPYLSEGDEYCPSGTWTFAVTSGLSLARATDDRHQVVAGQGGLRPDSSRISSIRSSAGKSTTWAKGLPAPRPPGSGRPGTRPPGDVRRNRDAGRQGRVGDRLLPGRHER